MIILLAHVVEQTSMRGRVIRDRDDGTNEEQGDDGTSPRNGHEQRTNAGLRWSGDQSKGAKDCSMWTRREQCGAALPLGSLKAAILPIRKTTVQAKNSLLFYFMPDREGDTTATAKTR
jgi:hypothetical protein